MRKLLVASAGVVVAVLGVRVVFRSGTRGRRLLRRTGDRCARAVRNWGGKWQGASYRLRGRRPDPDITDDVLADRIRSSIGPVVARLDIPHVHVMVQDGTARLHGAVGTPDDVEQIERAVRAVSGVVGVESFLHVGLGRGDTRPSEGARHRAPSDALRRLLGAATGAGVDAQHALVVVRAVLGALAERIPVDERDQLAGHLPEDARVLLEPPRRTGLAAKRIRTVPELMAAVAGSVPGVLGPEQVAHVVEATLAELRGLVPEEAADIAAQLPQDLRRFWEFAVPG